MENKDLMEKLISLCKRRGFIYQGSEIYGGLAGTYDYGPLGVLLKNNIKNTWWKRFVQDRIDMYGIDAAILMNQEVWKASGQSLTTSSLGVPVSSATTSVAVGVGLGDDLSSHAPRVITADIAARYT
jgi:hypothetical protein